MWTSTHDAANLAEVVLRAVDLDEPLAHAEEAPVAPARHRAVHHGGGVPGSLVEEAGGVELGDALRDPPAEVLVLGFDDGDDGGLDLDLRPREGEEEVAEAVEPAGGVHGELHPREEAHPVLLHPPGLQQDGGDDHLRARLLRGHRERQRGVLIEVPGEHRAHFDCGNRREELGHIHEAQPELPREVRNREVFVGHGRAGVYLSREGDTQR